MESGKWVSSEHRYDSLFHRCVERDERLGELDPDAGLGAPSSPAAAASVQPDTARPQATSKPSMSAKKAARPRPRRHDPNDENVRFVGGIWFV